MYTQRARRVASRAQPDVGIGVTLSKDASGKMRVVALQVAEKKRRNIYTHTFQKQHAKVENKKNRQRQDARRCLAGLALFRLNQPPNRA
jgi:hypothetical protein